jgi:hypothetical protein
VTDDRMDPVADLADFLLARIAEDEEVARGASPGPWHPNAERDEVLAVDDITVCDGFALSGPQTRATTTHIARHDPARVLAECRSKRRIVEPWSSGQDEADWRYGIHADAHEYVLRVLAEQYADHPDYDEEWKV